MKIRMTEDCEIGCLPTTEQTPLPPEFQPRKYDKGKTYEAVEVECFNLAPIGKIDADWAGYMIEHGYAERVLT
ncbi:hypothetical protein LCGC14_2134410 [marine sediment metagenome]|uniref:Uncharacterized protein n=1 Tax=marine sediment metagenome TaxID=412755 RepID=A0A0F9GDG1_9ZZZZ